MTPLIYEMTQGDPFYTEIACVDQYGYTVDLSTWTFGVSFRASIVDPTTLLSLTIANQGLLSIASNVFAINIAAEALSDIEINPRPRNGDLVPWTWIYGDLKLLPPAPLECSQGEGARTAILIKLFMGVTP